MRSSEKKASLVCATMALSALGWHAAAAPPKNVAVRSTVLDYAGDVAPRLNIQSDGLGDYVNASTLTSQIQAVGDWELDAKNPKGATRRLTIDFAEPIAGSGPGGIDPTPPPAAAFKFRVIAKCSLYGNSLLQFAAGAVKTCPLHIGFDYNGVTWAYQMDPYTAANGPFPQTNYATVTCIYPTSGSSPCSQWKFTPSGTYVEADGTVRYRNVAKLLEYQTSRGRSVVVDHGDFHVSFSMLIVR